MSTSPNQYALVKNNKVVNIIVAMSADIDTITAELDIDKYVLLTDENFYEQPNKATIGTNVTSTDEFIPASWVKNSSGEFEPPTSMPTDGNVYDWLEETVSWRQLTQFPSWSWDPVNKVSEAPILKPEDGKEYVWKEEVVNWVEVPPIPTDGKSYAWDESANSWVEIPD